MAPLDPVTRLKLARGVVERTCEATGAGFLLIMFLPGTDLMLRSFTGLDSDEECAAMAAEVHGLMATHAAKLTQESPVVAKPNGR